MGRGPSLIKSVAIGQRWRRRSTGKVYSVYMVWRKDRQLWLWPTVADGDASVRLTVDELRRGYEPVDMYIDPEIIKRERES